MFARYQELYEKLSLPEEHKNYLLYMRDQLQIYPRVIYDIGACTLHWYRAAKEIWPNAEIYAFDVLLDFEKFYQLHQVKYHLGCLGLENSQVNFYSNPFHPAGNSYYQENCEINPTGKDLYQPQIKFTESLDRVIRQHHWPLPDLIKLDVQGAELDILKSATQCLDHAKNLILELQTQEYNLKAPLLGEVDHWLNSQNFKKFNNRFSGSELQGDYHYTRN